MWKDIEKWQTEYNQSVVQFTVREFKNNSEKGLLTMRKKAENDCWNHSEKLVVELSTKVVMSWDGCSMVTMRAENEPQVIGNE